LVRPATELLRDERADLFAVLLPFAEVLPLVFVWLFVWLWDLLLPPLLDRPALALLRLELLPEDLEAEAPRAAVERPLRAAERVRVAELRLAAERRREPFPERACLAVSRLTILLKLLRSPPAVVS
jgi:hypothetical protein